MQFINFKKYHKSITGKKLIKKEKTKNVLLENNQPVQQCLAKRKKTLLRQLIHKRTQYTK